MPTFRCPRCGSKLKHIQGGCEWLCENPKCPDNQGEATYAEFYGTTQREINTQ